MWLLPLMFEIAMSAWMEALQLAFRSLAPWLSFFEPVIFLILPCIQALTLHERILSQHCCNMVNLSHAASQLTGTGYPMLGLLLNQPTSMGILLFPSPLYYTITAHTHPKAGTRLENPSPPSRLCKPLSGPPVAIGSM